MAYRKRGLGDWIPTSGEGRALLEVKGRVGGKGAGMRRSYRSSRRGYGGEQKSKYKWSRPVPANVNWQFDTGNGAWGIWTINDTPFGAPRRVLTITSGDTSVDDPNASVYVKRLIFDLGFHANITKVRTAGGIVNFDKTARDDIPPGAYFDGTTPGGILLDGDFATDDTRYAAQSYMEGLTICWALIYEDSSQADQPLNLSEGGWFDPNAPQLVEKNMNIFQRGSFQVALYKPHMLRIRKSFTGRGVQLLPGSREVKQISLVMWAYNPGGTTIRSQLAMVPADARYQYLDND